SCIITENIQMNSDTLAYAPPKLSAPGLACHALLVAIAAASLPVHAGTTIEVGDNSSITIGAGMRVSGKMTEDAAPNGDTATNFDVENLRLYIGAQITDLIKFTINTDEIFGDGPVDVLDAIAQF